MEELTSGGPYFLCDFVENWMTDFDLDMNRLVSAEKSSEDGWSAVD